MIPHIIHHIWLNYPMPDMYREFVKGWQRHHPSWNFQEWNVVEGEKLLEKKEPELAVLFNHAEQFCSGRNVFRFRANIMRAAILYHVGGVYVDADVESLKPIDELIRPFQCFISRESASKTRFGNAVMGSEAGHPFLRMLMAGMTYNTLLLKEQEKKKLPSYMLTGTRYMSEMVNALVTNRYENVWGEVLTWGERLYDWKDNPHLQIFLPKFFYPYSYSRLDRGAEAFPEAYAAHHWSNEREARKKPLVRS